MKSLTDITADRAHALAADNAILIDVRERYEQARERIAGAMTLPLSELAHGAPVDLPPGKAAVFLCASGNRTAVNAVALASLADGEAYNMIGGIAAWKRLGLPTERG